MRCIILVCVSLQLLQAFAKYEPEWDSLDKRPLPSWYDEAKVGIFIHWGVFSVPSVGTYTKNLVGSDWFWHYWKEGDKNLTDFMTKNYPPGFTYADFAKSFTAEFYNPVDWAKLFKDAGAKYVVLTSKHHEGFCNWPTNVSYTWNSKRLGPNRDLVGDLATAIRANTDIKFGLYHSLYEWYNPLYLMDKANGYNTQEFVNQKTMPELYELVNTYKPEIVWSDGQWEAEDTYWNSRTFIAWLYNQSPVRNTVVVNDRWGKSDKCVHGDFLTCADRYSPGVLQKKKWESCFTIDKASWGYVRTSTLADYMTPEEMIAYMANVIANGGNVLVNVGATPDGRIPPLMEERLRQMGAWLDINGAAIYSSVPWKKQNDTITKGVWYTSVKSAATPAVAVYGIVLNWPVASTLVLGVPKPAANTVVNMLGYDEPLPWTLVGGKMSISFPNMADVTSQWAWTLSFTHLTN